MVQIEAIIERASDGTYSVYCKHEIFSGMGDTIQAAKDDMAEQMAGFKQIAIEEGFKYPSFLDDEFEIIGKIIVNVFIEKTESGYSAYMDDSPLDYGCIGEGDTLDSTIEDFKRAYEEMKAHYASIGKQFTEADFKFILC